MSPPVVVALLAGGFAAGWVGRSVRAAGREWQWTAEAADAYREVAFLAQRNEELHKAIAATFPAGYDIGFGEAAGIQVDLGGIEP